jgi:tetratricopeptide (TPR) repeat protein
MPVASDAGRGPVLVFVSYATADRKQALAVCKAIERRGTKCWISSRDVPPGENYQEAIVRALRDARAMVLVFSGAANNSDEIKKELSLASRYHVPVMALRIEDVEPADAFAYELSTRQWIDAFNGWEKSIDMLVNRVGEMRSAPAAVATPPRQATPAASRRRLILGATAIAVLLAIAFTTLRWFKPAPAAAQDVTVRLAGFQRLSGGLPPALPDAMRDEIIAAFGNQGFVGASTAPAPPPGSAPAYALGGTIRRDGNRIRVIARLSNERSGTTLWSNSFDYGADQIARVPRRTAVDAGNMVRCGLYGASTYHRALPDAALSDYMQYCQTAVFLTDPGKGLDSAKRVVVAVPDFSWGWSAVAVAAGQNIFSTAAGPRRQELRRQGLEAANKAIALDPANSEAMAQKSILIDRTDHVAQEALLKRALAARPLACGCEHFVYGIMLQNVGRFVDSVTEFQRATDMLALDGISQFALADALLVTGKASEAKPHFAAAIDLFPGPDIAGTIAISEATEGGGYAAGIRAETNPQQDNSEARRAAVLKGFQAMENGNASAKASAVAALVALRADEKDVIVTRLLGALGANREALAAFAGGLGSRFDWLTILWYPSMRGALSDPAFPALAQRLGLIRYWRTTHTKPDVCSTSGPPPFCRLIG